MIKNFNKKKPLNKNGLYSLLKLVFIYNKILLIFGSPLPLFVIIEKPAFEV